MTRLLVTPLDSSFCPLESSRESIGHGWIFALSALFRIRLTWLGRPGALFSKVAIINGSGKLTPFTLKIEVSIVLHLT